MKKLIILFVATTTLLALITLLSCTTEEEYPEPSQEIVDVRLSFDKYYPNYSTEPMGRVSAVEFVNNITDSMCTVTVAAIDLNGDGSNLIMHKEMNLLHELIISLNVGWNYTIYVDPDQETIPTTGELVFSGMSDGFFATIDMNTILIHCQTNQSLVIIENNNMHETDKPLVEFYSDNTFTVLENTYDVGLSGDWYYMYIVEFDKGYRYIINKSDGSTAYAKMFNLVSGLKYTIMVHLLPPEEGTGSLVIDIDGAFVNTDLNL